MPLSDTVKVHPVSDAAARTVTLPPITPYLMLLPIRLMSSWVNRLWSAKIVQPCGTWFNSRISDAAALSDSSSITEPTRLRNSSVSFSRWMRPSYPRVSISSWDMILFMRALSLRIAARLWAASPADSPASSSSAQAEITATGVRSSWEASEVNCRSRLKERSSRSSMVLKVTASSCTSSLVAMPVIRRERSPARMLSAALVMEIEDSLWQMRRKTAPVRREEVKNAGIGAV